MAGDWPADALEVGRIVDAWGVKGWLKVQPFSSDPQTLLASRTWFLQPPERGPGPAAAGRSALPSTLAVQEARLHGDVVVAQAEGCNDRSAAEALRGVRVFIARSEFPPAGDDAFYWVDLIGLEVVNRQDERLGRVVGLIDTGPHSVLRVASEAAVTPEVAAADERLIPFVSAYVDDVDLAARGFASTGVSTTERRCASTSSPCSPICSRCRFGRA